MVLLISEGPLGGCCYILGASGWLLKWLLLFPGGCWAQRKCTCWRAKDDGENGFGPSNAGAQLGPLLLCQILPFQMSPVPNSPFPAVVEASCPPWGPLLCWRHIQPNPRPWDGVCSPVPMRWAPRSPSATHQKGTAVLGISLHPRAQCGGGLQGLWHSYRSVPGHHVPPGASERGPGIRAEDCQ